MTEAQFLAYLPTEILIEGDMDKRSASIDGIRINPAMSMKVHCHASDFCWGYGGSGPAQFALALLMEYVDGQTAHKYHQQLKWGWIAGLPQTDFIKTINLRQIMTEILEKK